MSTENEMEAQCAEEDNISDQLHRDKIAARINERIIRRQEIQIQREIHQSYRYQDRIRRELKQIRWEIDAGYSDEYISHIHVNQARRQQRMVDIEERLNNRKNDEIDNEEDEVHRAQDQLENNKHELRRAKRVAGEY